MKPTDVSICPLNRRAWLALAGAALSGCGGGDLLGALPGTGGTGAPMFAQGSIAGFGSIIVNGITFNDVQAQVLINGIASTAADLRLGMVADVEADRGADLTLATARRIEVWSIAQGNISQATASSFRVAGMTLQTDGNTVFDGVSAAGQLQAGQTVAVWGLQVTADGTVWQATRVAVQAASGTTVSSGLVQAAGGQLVLSGLILSGTAVGNLVPGGLVRVQGTLSADGLSLAVSSAKSLDVVVAYPTQGAAEIEGFVTALIPASRLTMGNMVVDISTASITPSGAQLALGARIEVYGHWSAGLLIAYEVEIEDAQILNVAEIKGVISRFASLADFEVRGQRCNAVSAEFSHGSASDLQVGAKVKVSGTKAGDVLMLTKLEFDD